MDTNLYKYNSVSSGLPVIPKKGNTKKYVLVLLVLIVAGVAVFAFVKKDSLMGLVKKEEPTVNLSPARQLNLEKRSLLVSSTIKFDLVVQTVPIAIDKLPAVLKKFVDESGSDLKIEQVKYGGGSAGYEISYILKDIKMQDVERGFQIIALGNKFEMLKGLRAEMFGFADYKNAEYEVRVSYILNEGSMVIININIINTPQ